MTRAGHTGVAGRRLQSRHRQHESIANIQIALAASIGMGTRGDFYDKTGALRDMIQNHALQLLTMIAMEPPPSNDADAIRDGKLKVLKSLRPFPRVLQKVFTAQRAMPRDAALTQALRANEQGFSLHAAVRCAAHDLQALEQLCR